MRMQAGLKEIKKEKSDGTSAAPLQRISLPVRYFVPTTMWRLHEEATGFAKKLTNSPTSEQAGGPTFAN